MTCGDFLESTLEQRAIYYIGFMDGLQAATLDQVHRRGARGSALAEADRTLRSWFDPDETPRQALEGIEQFCRRPGRKTLDVLIAIRATRMLRAGSKEAEVNAMISDWDRWTKTGER